MNLGEEKPLRRIILRLTWACEFLAAIVLLSLVAGPSAEAIHAAAGQMTTIVAGVPKSFPPQYIVDKAGNPGGFAIEVMGALAKRAGFKVDYRVFDSWADVHNALKAGRIDIIPNLGITGDRQRYADFTSPVEAFRVVIFTRESDHRIRGIEDLPEHRVGVVAANVGVQLMEGIAGVDAVLFHDVREALFELLSGSIDAVVYPEPVLMKVAVDAGLDDRIKVAGQPLLEVKRAVAVRKGDAELLGLLGRAVAEFVGTAEYEKIYVKWYGNPRPYWNPRRMQVLFAVMLAAFAAIIITWRYVIMAKHNRQLRLNIEERKRIEKDLMESEEKFRSLSERSVMGVYLIQDGVFTYVNPKLAEILGYTTEEMIDKMGPNDVVLPEDWPIVEENIRRRIDDEIESVNYEFRCLNKSGKMLDAEVFGKRTLYKGKPAVIGSFLDITGRKRAEERVQYQLDRITALRDIDTAINASLDLNVTLHVFLEHVLSQLKVDAAAVMLLNPYAQVLRCAAKRGFSSDNIFKNMPRTGEGCMGRIALEGKPILAPDLSRLPEELKTLGFVAEEGFRAFFGMPLISKGAVKGVLALFCRKRLEPEPDWVSYFETLAGQAAIAIDNASMFEETKRSNTELRMAYDATIEGWSMALDYRDRETEGHSQRVTELTMRVAQAMGIKDDELVYVRWGALLHDIGKLGVPDSILLKPGKLTDDEWVKMKMHPTIAFQLLSPIEFLRPAVDIPHCHHEKWDGTGYPGGLKGKEIPLPARIFSVVDVWDALRSDRPYRPAWSADKAEQYIKSLAGVEFDPDIVDTFFKHLA